MSNPTAAQKTDAPVTDLHLYNTFSQTKEPFSSTDPAGRKARIYVCGVTPYDTSHAGHALTAVVFDTLRRYLIFLGFEVTHTQNLTDVDDDIIKRANRDNVPFDQLGQQWDEVYRTALAAINCLPFDHYVPASHAIPQIITMVEKFLEQGQAYQASDGNVYFRAASFPAYGALSHLTEAEMLEKARAAAADSLVDDPDNPAKESVLDFILWQSSRPGEPSWQTSFGAGRPGWHIECSAINLDTFGPQLEIHGGGADLIFPHHSSEIAQSESFTGQSPFVKYWMHVGMLRIDGEKMSKSLGNLVLVRDVLKSHSADALRLYLLSNHYRQPLDYEASNLDVAEDMVGRYKLALTAQDNSQGESLDVSDYRRRFLAALDNDLDTPIAIRALSGLTETIIAQVGQNIGPAQATLRELLGILGLFVAEPDAAE